MAIPRLWLSCKKKPAFGERGLRGAVGCGGVLGGGAFGGGAAFSADGALVGGHASLGVFGDGLDEFDGVAGPEVGADFFGEAFGSVEHAAADDDLEVGAGTDVVEAVDEQAGIGHGGGDAAEDHELVDVEVGDLVGDLVVAHAAAAVVDAVAIGFEEVGGELAGEFFGLFGAGHDQNGLVAAGVLLVSHLELVGDGA